MLFADCRMNILNMPKVILNLEMDYALYRTLQEIAKSQDITVEAFLEQEFDRIVSDIVTWLKRLKTTLSV